MTVTNLVDALHAHTGVISCVGAGGKKSTMFRLAAAHNGRVGITATAHIEFFPKNLDATCYVAEEAVLLETIANDEESKVIAFARPSSRFGRRAGIAVDNVLRFKQAGKFELLLIKADGARGRFVKAPASHEPVLSGFTDIVIPVLSAKVIGQPLSNDIAHRVDILESIFDIREMDIIQPIHIARLLSSEQGLLKDTGSANVIPLINMVDDVDTLKSATAAAEQALEMTSRFDRVVLAAMKKETPIVRVIERWQ